MWLKTIKSGDYEISVKWSGQHVPNSPFHVRIFDTRVELDRFMQQQQQSQLEGKAKAQQWTATDSERNEFFKLEQLFKKKRNNFL